VPGHEVVRALQRMWLTFGDQRQIEKVSSAWAVTPMPELLRVRQHAHRNPEHQHRAHVLGASAFGTQLLCEQVIGRALRRQSYELNNDGLFNVEYAYVLGIPFDFNAERVVAPPQKPRRPRHYGPARCGLTTLGAGSRMAGH
jgi:hypothetical protein